MGFAGRKRSGALSLVKKPAITVVIPTYNWSAALRCAITSVLLQTEQNFEVLVVGDGCTDDSEAVVAEFNDPRIRWHNLDRNYGSQWVANNYGNEHAAADWIAYLGHDDIWYPTHLEAVLRTAAQSGADVVTSILALYGPPESGVRGLAGAFASGSYSSNDFVPPSAFAHARSIYGDGVKWCDPASVTLPMDALFMNQAVLAAKRFASTRELTSFKFNAAWRRDSYKIKTVTEQERMLARIRQGDFRQEEFVGMMEAVAGARFISVEMPSVHGVEPGWFVRGNRKNKGSDSRFKPSEIRRIDRKLRFDLSGQTMPFEWYAPERNRRHGSFRWSGPSRSSTIDLPVVFDTDLLIRIRVIDTITPRTSVAASIRGARLPSTVKKNFWGGFTIEAVAKTSDIAASDRDFGITIEVDATQRPRDLGINDDTRWLGAAVGWVELQPLPVSKR